MSVKTTKSQSIGFREQLISGGNNQVFKRKIRTINRIKNQNTDLEWEFHMKIIHMYSEIITFVSKDKNLEDYFNSLKLNLVKELYWKGEVAVSKFEEKYGIFELKSNIKKAVDGFVNSANCRSVYGQEERVIKAGNNGAFLFYDQYRFSIFIGLDYWKNKIIELQEILMKDVRGSTSKQILFFNKEDLKDDTLVEKWTDVNDITEGQIKLMVGKPIDKQELKTVSNSDNIIKTINYFWNQMLNFRGFQTNVSQKESGVAVEEMNINLEQIGTVMNSYLMFWKKFVQDLNKSYNLDLEVEKTDFRPSDKLTEEQNENIKEDKQ